MYKLMFTRARGSPKDIEVETVSSSITYDTKPAVPISSKQATIGPHVYLTRIRGCMKLNRYMISKLLRLALNLFGSEVRKRVVHFFTGLVSTHVPSPLYLRTWHDM